MNGGGEPERKDSWTSLKILKKVEGVPGSARMLWPEYGQKRIWKASGDRCGETRQMIRCGIERQYLMNPGQKGHSTLLQTKITGRISITSNARLTPKWFQGHPLHRDPSSTSMLSMLCETSGILFVSDSCIVAVFQCQPLRVRRETRWPRCSLSGGCLQPLQLGGRHFERDESIWFSQSLLYSVTVCFLGESLCLRMFWIECSLVDLVWWEERLMFSFYFFGNGGSDCLWISKLSQQGSRTESWISKVRNFQYSVGWSVCSYSILL